MATQRAARLIPATFAAYDDLLDVLHRQGARLDPMQWDMLVDRLAAHDVTYLAGGTAALHQSAVTRKWAAAELEDLLRDLACAPEPRLRDALIALLLVHPEYATATRNTLTHLPMTDPRHASLLARLLVAAALQRRHMRTLAARSPAYATIEVADLVAAYGLPRPEESGGQALLEAVQGLVRGRFREVDYISGWEDAAHHTLHELRSLKPAEVLWGHAFRRV